MTRSVRRPAAWIADRGAAGVSGVTAALGAAAGTLAGLATAAGETRLGDAESAAAVGFALGGGIGLVVWVACGLIARDAAMSRNSGSGRLFNEFCRYNQGRIGKQWHVLLEGGNRLPSPFKGSSRIAPPWSFTGSLSGGLGTNVDEGETDEDLARAVATASAPEGGPRLLVMGKPGYGKTVGLLDIAQHLIHGEKGRFGVPVIFNLGSWRGDDDDLAVWMVRTLCNPTGPLPGSDELVMEWITNGRIAPMLDGLDEILDGDTRRACVAAINAFIYGALAHTALVVASRPDEYTAISDGGGNRLAVNAAIELEPIRPSLVAARLGQASSHNEGAGDVADLVEGEPTHPVAELLRVPLWLWMAVALDDRNAAKLKEAASADEAQAILADAFVARTVAELDSWTDLNVLTSRRFLAVIAGFLADQTSPDATTFRFEDLTPTRPPPKLASQVALVVGLVGGLGFGLVYGLGFGQEVGLVGGLVGGLIGGLVGGLVVGLVYGLGVDARPTHSRLRWPGAVGMAPELVLGLGSGLLLGLVYGLAVGLVLGLVGALVYGLFGIRDVAAEKIDEGRAASVASLALHTTAVGLGFALGFWVIGGLGFGVIYGLVVGLVLGGGFGLQEGGWYIVLQRDIRGQSYRENLLPKDPVRFVRAASEAGILRQVGGGVQFRHRAIADRLAMEAPTHGLADLRRQRRAVPTDGRRGSSIVV